MAGLDLERFAEEVRSIVEDAIEANFESPGRQSKLQWAPLSDAYVAMLARRGKLAGKKILIDTGRLRGSIITGIERGPQTKIVAKTNVQYAAAHQFGTRRIPARPYLALLDEDIHDIRQLAITMLGPEIARRIVQMIQPHLEGA